LLSAGKPGAKAQSEFADLFFMENKMESWKDIEGYEGLYKISNFGKVKSLSRYVKNNKINSKKLIKERILSQTDNRNGYKYVSLSRNGKAKHFYIHILVGCAFIKRGFNSTEINHINGDKSNNKDKNLEWVTRKQNINHAIKIGLINISGERHYKHKLTDQQALDIRKELKYYKYGMFSQIARKYNVNDSIIRDIYYNNTKYGT
jgi:hypothetical protein